MKKLIFIKIIFNLILFISMISLAFIGFFEKDVYSLLLAIFLSIQFDVNLILE